MKLCERCNIVHEQEGCPLCSVEKRILEIDADRARLEEKIWQLEGTIADLEYKNERLKA